MPCLKRLTFVPSAKKKPDRTKKIQNVLTPKLVKAIFTSSYFEQLESLDLSETNLDFRHFLFLSQTEKAINSNLIDLSLGNPFVICLENNSLEKRAFKLLKSINFQGKLKSLDIAGNSFIDPEIIESIINIIKPTDGEKSDITSLNVFWTSITTDNLIQLL